MKKALNSDISARLLDLRKGLKLNQKQIADRLEITRAYWSALERGERKPSAKVIELLQDLFGISSDWLLRGKGSPSEFGDTLNDSLVFAEIEHLYDELVHIDRQIMYLIEIREKTFGEELGYSVYLDSLAAQVVAVNIHNLDKDALDAKGILERLKLLLPAFKKDFDELFHQYFLDVIHPRWREQFVAPENVKRLGPFK